MPLREKLRHAERSRLLRYIAQTIHGFTIMARDDVSVQVKSAINNRIHYLAGHIVGLSDPAEPLTETRLDGIIEQVTRLNGGIAAEIEAELAR